MVEIAWKEAVKNLKSYKPNVGMERSTVHCIAMEFLKAISVSPDVLDKVIRAEVLASQEGLFEEAG